MILKFPPIFAKKIYFGLFFLCVAYQVGATFDLVDFFVYTLILAKNQTFANFQNLLGFACPQSLSKSWLCRCFDWIYGGVTAILPKKWLLGSEGQYFLLNLVNLSYVFLPKNTFWLGGGWNIVPQIRFLLIGVKIVIPKLHHLLVHFKNSFFNQRKTKNCL